MLCHSLIILLFIKSPSVTSKCCTPVCMAAAAFAAEGGEREERCRYSARADGISTTAAGGIDYVGESDSP